VGVVDRVGVADRTAVAAGVGVRVAVAAVVAVRVGVRVAAVVGVALGSGVDGVMGSGLGVGRRSGNAALAETHAVLPDQSEPTSGEMGWKGERAVTRITFGEG
jgi:hypothetical protein